ncbi:hypothetical protein GLU60_02230 [Nanohaloarchaea archaeon H01]|nr:hypothetical protein [Nanohaloarchaea archaeon H01]
MTVEITDPDEFDIESLYEDARAPKNQETTPHSVHTSVGLKVLYLEESDSFEVAITETNAFPEAQEYCDSIHDEEWIENTVEALTSALPEEDKEVVVNMPGNAFDGNHKWLKSEKEEIADKIEERVERFETTRDGEDLSVTEERVELDDVDFDYVLNLSDVGDQLNPTLSGFEATSRIVNAPTAVWNTRYSKTGKSGLQNTAENVTQELDVDGVHVPKNRSVEYLSGAVDEAQRFFEDGDSAVLKGDFGTHGDEVVYLNREEYEDLSTHFGLSIDEYVQSQIQAVEQRVSEKSTSEDDYSLFDESDQFNGRGESNTAVVERAVEDGYEVNGEELKVLDYNGRPIDLVFSVWDTGEEYRPELR